MFLFFLPPGSRFRPVPSFPERPGDLAVLGRADAVVFAEEAVEGVGGIEAAVERDRLDGQFGMAFQQPPGLLQLHCTDVFHRGFARDGPDRFRERIPVRAQRSGQFVAVQLRMHQVTPVQQVFAQAFDQLELLHVAREFPAGGKSALPPPRQPPGIVRVLPRGGPVP